MKSILTALLCIVTLSALVAQDTEVDQVITSQLVERLMEKNDDLIKKNQTLNMQLSRANADAAEDKIMFMSQQEDLNDELAAGNACIDQLETQIAELQTEVTRLKEFEDQVAEDKKFTEENMGLIYLIAFLVMVGVGTVVFGIIHGLNFLFD